MSNDYTHFWDDKPFLKELAEVVPAIAIGGPVVEHLRVHYWTKIRDIASTDSKLRQIMPGMLVAPDRINVYIGDSHLAVEYFGPSHVPGKLTENAIKVTFIDYRYEGDFISNIIGMKFEGTGLKFPVVPSDLYWNLFVPTSTDAVELMMEIGWDMTAETWPS